MHPLPRLLGLSLFLALAVLTAALAIPAPGTVAASQSRLASLPRRLALPLAATSLVLSTALIFSLALRRAPSATDPEALDPRRAEMDTLTSLARSTAAQGAALAEERQTRARAEADAELNQRLLLRSLEEKVRLGHDLHDGIIQSLYATGLNLESARSLLAADPAEADRRLAFCRDSLNATIREVRAYIGGLTPDHLQRAGFSAALQSLANELAAGRSVRVDLDLDEDAASRLGAEQSKETLQIAREAVSNALRHGSASVVSIRLRHDAGQLLLVVQDDGRGFDPERLGHTGHGLANLQARAARLGATLRIESASGTGTRVLLTVPVCA